MKIWTALDEIYKFHVLLVTLIFKLCFANFRQNILQKIAKFDQICQLSFNLITFQLSFILQSSALPPWASSSLKRMVPPPEPPVLDIAS